MALLGTGALVNWGGIAPGTEADYMAWHSFEHMPERVGLPGFTRGRRAEGVPGTPAHRRWFMMYETEAPEVFASAPYRARLDDPTPWTRRVLATYVSPVRTVCRVVASHGAGVGGWLATWTAEDLGALPGDVAAMAGWPGVTGAHLLEGVAALTTLPSAERGFREARGEADAGVGAALIVETLDRAGAEAAMDRLGLSGGDLYVVQHVLVPADLS